MDALDKAIEAKRKQRDDLQQRLEVVVIELRALEEAAALRPVRAPADEPLPVPPVRVRTEPSVEPKRGGREPGSISKKWRKALEDLAKRNNPYRSFGDVFLVVSKHVNSSQPAIRERVRAYVTMGFMEEEDGSYRVSQHAIEKFKMDLTVREDPAAIELGSSLMNGAGPSPSA